MNRISYILSVSSILFLILPLVSVGQNNTSSPYSKFGIGDMASTGYGRNLALGGSGLGLRDPFHINMKNPASLTMIDSMNFLFETGVNLQKTYSSSIDFNQDYWDGNLTHIAFAHRYSNRLMGSMGLMPYTNIGYRLRTTKSLEGEESFALTDWAGYGGINKLFYSLGFKASDQLSLGVEFGYYYGPILERRKTWTQVQTENPTYYSSNTRYNSVSFKGAFQYSLKLNEKGTRLTLGGYLSPGQKFWGESDILIQQQYGPNITDSIYYAEDRATSIYIPLSYGAGFGLILSGKYLLAADVDFSDWSTVNKDKMYIDQVVYSLGFEILPQNKLDYFKRCSYRFGFRYDSGYIQTKGYSIDDMRLSLGMGFPILKSATMVNLTFEAGQRGTLNRGMIREQYMKMTVAFSFHDYWFVPRKLN